MECLLLNFPKKPAGGNLEHFGFDLRITLRLPFAYLSSIGYIENPLATNHNPDAKGKKWFNYFKNPASRK